MCVIRDGMRYRERTTMSGEWWGGIVQWTIWAVVMALVMGWVARSRHRSRPAVVGRRLVHPPSTLIIGLTCFAFFAAIAVLSNVYSNKTTTVVTTAVFVGFALMGLAVIADYIVARHDVSDEGLSYSRLTGGRGSLRWDEVARVTYAPGLKWFKIETRSGKVARVSAMLVGLPGFAQTVLARVPASAIDDTTRPVLEATAAGQPPPVWG